jgi:hypothetical protein
MKNSFCSLYERQLCTNIMTALTISVLLVVTVSVSNAKTIYVKGKMRKDGIYVKPHYKSSRDKSRYNNYGTIGNVNPHTGKRGTRKF